MLKKIGDFYALVFGNTLFYKINRGLFYLSCRGLGLLNYSSNRLSGEIHVISTYVPPKGKPIIFDVGANKGNWSKSVLDKNPNSQLHIFEPNKTHSINLENLSANTVVNNVAVGDQNCGMLLFDYEDNFGSEHASLIDGVIDNIHNKKSKTTEVQVITLDHYCSENKIFQIDFLKIDTEGFEYKVLAGAKEILKKTKVIQFEFNEMNTINRIYFKDFFYLLNENFRIFRLLPYSLIEINSYSALHNELFVFQNFLAINRNA